ncbi:MAG: hypothetical protein R2702_18185 [Acidimicrobiales bacterium]
MAPPPPSRPPLRRARAVAAGLLAVVLGSLGLLGCGGGSDDPAVTGPRQQAVEKLRDYGLTAEQARCIADDLGAEAVVEATDLNALADSQEYRDAADACIG